MAKKINFGTINEETVNTLSNFSVALEEQKKIDKKYRDDKKEIESRLKNTKEKRNNAILGGMNPNEAVEKFNIDAPLRELDKLNDTHKANVAPYKEAINKALNLVPNEIYHAYMLTIKKGDNSAKGKLKLGKDEIKVEKTFKTLIKEFLENIGIVSGTDTQIDKFATSMVVRCGGGKKANGENYITTKPAKQFKELFILSFLQFTIVEKGVIVKNDDNTLSMKVFDEEGKTEA